MVKCMRELGSAVARVLAIGGSDSGAGAGIQADLKTVMALGGYATTVITAVTAQNTVGVVSAELVDVDLIEAQMRAVLDDIGADVIKTGMLGSSAIVARVAAVLREDARGAMLVVDPVMIAKGGASLLDEGGRAAVLSELVPLATLVTPNIDELAALTGREVSTPDDMELAAQDLLGAGAARVLAKGGHLDGALVVDVFCDRDGMRRRFSSPRIPSTSTHGTGCTLASAIAMSLAQGMSVVDAVERARSFVREAILAAPKLGTGHGPMDHAAAGHVGAPRSARSNEL
jgi:hydroxymethylpyrimidine/phosphomethylpyrimidine kinase